MKKNIFAFSFLFALFFVLSDFAFAASLEKPDYIINDKRIFLDAYVLFENQDYGASLKMLEKAKATRKNTVAWEIFTLKNSLKPAEVKKCGDYLPDIKKVLIDRQDYDALEIFDRYDEKFTFDFFENSVKKLLAYIEEHKEYPEADYLIGKIYQIEGDFVFAEKFYKSALSKSEILDVMEEKYDIMYSLADLCMIQADYKSYENYLNLIVSQDSSYTDETLLIAMKKTLNTPKKDAMEKFFLMYRIENHQVFKAYFMLSEYYLLKNELDRALITSALGTLAGFSKIHRVIAKRNPEFVYDGVASVLQEASKYSEIVEWGKNNNLWRGFNDFAENSFLNSNVIFSLELYKVLKDYLPEEYWRKNANERYNAIAAKF